MADGLRMHWSVRCPPMEEFALGGGSLPQDQFLMLWAYLDDSGKWDWHKGSTPSLGFAGAVAAVSKWCAFIREWREILDTAGVQHFHASEWARRSDTFLSLLAPCVCKWARPVGSVMPQIALALAWKIHEQ